MFSINNPKGAILSAFGKSASQPLEKGKKAEEGETRDWGGKKYRKQGGKWIEVNDPKAGGGKEESGGDKSKKPEEGGGKSTPSGPPMIDNHEIAQMTHMKKIMDENPEKAYEIFQSLSPESQSRVPQDVVNKMVESSHTEKDDGVDFDKLGKEEKKEKPKKKKEGSNNTWKVVYDKDGDGFIATDGKDTIGKNMGLSESQAQLYADVKSKDPTAVSVDPKKTLGVEKKKHNFSTNKDAFNEQVSRARNVYDNAMNDKQKKEAQAFLDGAKKHKEEMGWGEGGESSENKLYDGIRDWVGDYNDSQINNVVEAFLEAGYSQKDLKVPQGRSAIEHMNNVGGRADSLAKKIVESQKNPMEVNEITEIVEGMIESNFKISDWDNKKSGDDKIKKALETLGIEKARPTKYFKREGTAGNYKYYYTEEEYKKAKGGDKKE